jgi:hypothetical protein
MAVIIHNSHCLPTIQAQSAKDIRKASDALVKGVIIVTDEVFVNDLPFRFQYQGIIQQAFYQQGELTAVICRGQFLYSHVH